MEGFDPIRDGQTLLHGVLFVPLMTLPRLFVSICINTKDIDIGFEPAAASQRLSSCAAQLEN